MIYRYRKDGEMDIFTYVQWKDEDAQGYEKTVFAPQTKPLSDEEIKQIWYDLYPLSSSSYWDDKREGIAELKFARAIEERHGIK